MDALPNSQSHCPVERRKNARPEPSSRYKRLRKEIGSPDPIFAAARILVSRIGRSVRRTSVRIAGLRILLGALRESRKAGRFGPHH